jgi:nitrite reductase/ring-hydroxylating ferredoxin subunit
MAGRERVICRSSELVERGDGVRFAILLRGALQEAFAIRFEGQPRAYVNRCAHVPMELDWNPGKFFDAEGSALICSTHGALYHPTSGRCLGGPCRGRGLHLLAVQERDGMILIEDEGNG